MEAAVPGRLVGWDIHGFRTMKDLDMTNIMEEASGRWLRPNEIHAILCNHKYFSVNVKPVNLPKSGTIVLFDRKMLRNFRKDGHNWKKKKDGKTVKEAHEHLKVGNEERIHVYYAHGQDSPTFVRRCYWLLDKTLEHIVLVHYRETKEGSPATPVNSSSSSGPSDPSGSLILSEESDSAADRAYYASSEPPAETYETVMDHQMRLHEINTLEWDELLVNDTNKIAPEPGENSFEQQNQYEINGYRHNAFIDNDTLLRGNPLSNNLPAENQSMENPLEATAGNNSVPFGLQENISFQGLGGSQMDSISHRKGSEMVGASPGGGSLDVQHKDELQTQDSFGRWMNYIMTNPPELLDEKTTEPSLSIGHELFGSSITNHRHHQSLVTDNLFNITDISPAWALSTETTKILVVGFFNEGLPHLASSNLSCVCGDACVPAEIVQSGVCRFLLPPHNPGLVNFFLSLDGQKPISQVLTFEYRSPMQIGAVSSEDKSKLEEIRVQMRLAHLLFSTSKSLHIVSSKVPQNAVKSAKMFAGKTSHIIRSWENLIKSIEDNKISFAQAKDNLFEITLHNRLLEWLLERVVEGCKISERDDQGQGVIHLCAILGYRWAVYPFSWSGLSLDHRDKHGWTALHWAAYYGREEMVATLLSAGAKPNLVTDPTSEDRGGCTAADLASKNGYDGLAAYLAEKGLVDHFKDMTIAGNVSGSLQTTTTETVNPSNLSEEDLNLKDTLTAYRTAADAAARIQAAFRDHELKLRTKEVQFSNPEDEARSIIAAMRIQHAYRHHDTRKKMVAAARIQYRFRTWKIRKEFINMRRQAIKIQALFRGYQVRRQYKKIIWSVGVLEKAILRWRLKRKGFRGLQVEEGVEKDEKEENEVEDFFQASMKQAEERVERSVVKVQALFRSKRAQEDYQRMKHAHLQAKLEYEELFHPDTDMG